MKKQFYILVILAMVVTSCEQNGSRPEIDFHELGLENDKTAVVGADLHMDAEIVAENKIDRIEVEIHPEEDHSKKDGLINSDAGGWEFDSVYTKFSGLKNTYFHEHIEISADAEPGQYHFHFSVTDMEGYQTVYEDEFELLGAESGK